MHSPIYRAVYPWLPAPWALRILALSCLAAMLVLIAESSRQAQTHANALRSSVRSWQLFIPQRLHESCVTSRTSLQGLPSDSVHVRSERPRLENATSGFAMRQRPDEAL
jgi:hypothetical protein